MKKLALLCMVLLLCACARQAPAPGTPQGGEGNALATRWQAYRNAGTGAEAPYRLQLSLRFGEEGNTRRVTALLWGNGERELRLDVMAGVGTVVAKILEDGDHFLVYAPLENKAYFHQGATSPLLKVGVPVPFGLARLTALLTGHYAAAFGDASADASLLSDGVAQYTLEGKPGGLLSLDAAGRPVAWRESAANGWRMDIVYDDATPPLPRRLTLTHASGRRAIMLVKERENPPAPFTQEQMRLTLPEGAPLLPLARYRAPKS
ncbi:MAG: hypothetical protein HDQ94_00185 [Desulfovibrio sp.]|nr:hypothetical protein [Desulfovibrio sp.]